MHIIFYESNSLDPRKDIYSVDAVVSKFMETNAQEENTSKPLELEGPSKKESEEILQLTLKDDLTKD